MELVILVIVYRQKIIFRISMLCQKNKIFRMHHKFISYQVWMRIRPVHSNMSIVTLIQTLSMKMIKIMKISTLTQWQVVIDYQTPNNQPSRFNAQRLIGINLMKTIQIIRLKDCLKYKCLLQLNYCLQPLNAKIPYISTHFRKKQMKVVKIWSQNKIKYLHLNRRFMLKTSRMFN